MRFDILTIFPEIFISPLKASLLGKGIEKGIISINLVDLRDFTEDKHKSVDDTPFGGGCGMVMKPEPIVKALESIDSNFNRKLSIALTPNGRLYDQKLAEEYSGLDQLTIICGRYEGIDQRIGDYYVDQEISIGDYVLSGGEFAALAIVDSVSRLVPGLLGNKESLLEESFNQGLLEYPQYTRPRDFRGYQVPEVLLSGDHKRIKQWRHRKSLERTEKYRPSLYNEYLEKSGSS